MTRKPTEATIQVWIRLMRAQRLALSAVERALKAEDMPPLAWYDVLLEVERAGDGIRPFELERAMLLEQYNLSRLIDRIEQAGYVERRVCAEDGRGQLLVITDAGLAVRRRMWPVYARAIEAAIGQKLDEEQAAALDGLLRRITF